MTGDISLEELPTIASQYGFDGIDILDRYIDSADLGYVRSQTKALGLGVVLSVNTDFTVRSNRLNRQLSDFCHMLELARDLGASIVRFTLGGGYLSLQRVLDTIGAMPLVSRSSVITIQGLIQKLLLSKALSPLIQKTRSRKEVPPFDVNNCMSVVIALRKVLPLVNQLDIDLAIENHWGLSTNPDNILYVVGQIGSHRIGTCPDFGNFLDTQDRYTCLRKLLPKAKLVHAKSHGFDKAGEEISIDYKKCMQLIKLHDYQGDISVEYEGGGDGIQGAIQTRALIHRHLP